ncbi:MAG: dihydroneopterin aldolase [Cytophagaceae bacterium]|nr:dihydroneopterin aldolase [Cytophagaceae bacterium]
MKTEISLEALSFYAYHGFYEEERKSGNRFLVDIKVTTVLVKGDDADQISNTINYEDLYKVVKDEMAIPSRLLENVCKNILEKVFDKFPIAQAAEVSLSKLAPAVGGPCEKAKVTLKHSR